MTTIPKRKTFNAVYIAGLLLAAASGACSRQEPATPPDPADVARRNMLDYVQLMHSGQGWVVGRYCFTENMPDGKAKCTVDEPGHIGGRELFVRTFMFECDTAAKGSCSPYVDKPSK